MSRSEKVVESHPIPQPVRREVWFDLSDEYPGWRAKLWVNYPRSLFLEMKAGDQVMWAALKQVVLEHNGWPGQDGKPIPQPSEEQFWLDVPDELAGLLLIRALEASGKALSSLLRNSASLGSTSTPKTRRA